VLLPNFIKKIKNTDNAIFARILENEHRGENRSFEEWLKLIEQIKQQPV